MGYLTNWTDPKRGDTVEVYHNIRIVRYDHKRLIQFEVRKYKDKATFDANAINPQPLLLEKENILVAKTEGDVIFDTYFAVAIQQTVGKDLIGCCYDYIKGETTKMIGATDVLE